MRKLYKTFFLTPDDVGMRRYNVEEIAMRMKRSESVDQSSLLEFAKAVKFFLDENDDENNKKT